MKQLLANFPKFTSFGYFVKTLAKIVLSKTKQNKKHTFYCIFISQMYQIHSDISRKAVYKHMNALCPEIIIKHYFFSLLSIFCFSFDHLQVKNICSHTVHGTCHRTYYTKVGIPILKVCLFLYLPEGVCVFHHLVNGNK